MAAFPGSKWGQVVALASAVVTAEAPPIRGAFRPAVISEITQLTEERQSTRDPAEEAALETLSRAIRNCGAKIDAAGFLSVNGRLGCGHGDAAA